LIKLPIFGKVALMLPEIGPVELILIMMIVTMLFGVGKLPEVFGAVGKGVREFRSAVKAQDDVLEVNTVGLPTTPPPAPQQETPA
jgi:sec-independent protein translocase protein TatA